MKIDYETVTKRWAKRRSDKFYNIRKDVNLYSGGKRQDE